MRRVPWSVALAVTIAGALLVAALGVTGGSPELSTSSASLAVSVECSHLGGGSWERVWNNGSGSTPARIWVSMPGYYWATYNNSTGATESVGWGTPGTSANPAPGATLVNMTGQASTAEAMMQSVCQHPGPTIPWHFDFASRLFVRN